MSSVHRAVAAVPLVLIPALSVVQGGYQPDTWVWAGAIAAWGCAVAVVLTQDGGALRRAWPWVAASGALLLWTLASTAWSVHATQSLLEARRTLLYAAVVLALTMLARREASRLLVPATHAAVSLLFVYALARYLLGVRHNNTFEAYLLSEPLGYANAVGILAALGILLALGLAAASGAAVPRAAAASTVPLLATALGFSGSTASYLALGVGLAVIALLSPAVSRLLAAAALVAPATAIAAALAFYSRRADVGDPRISGPVLLASLLACAALAAVAVLRIRLPDADAYGSRARRAVLVLVVVLALGGAAAVAHSGSSQPRTSYFHVAWHDQVLPHPLLGTGAGTFGHYWTHSGRVLDFGGALDAHSLYLETLAELGPVGLLLLAAMLLLPLRGVIRHRFAPHVPAAAGAYIAFLVHAGLDWDWEMPVVVVAALCCAAAVATAELRPGQALSRAVRGAVLVASFALGAAAIAGARSHTVPAAAPETEKAPRNGALSQTRA
jgi:O-antigen ligase